MESKMVKIKARYDNRIELKVYPGHFATPQSHITHYMDLTTMRTRSAEARRIAEALADNYQVSTPVDTIVCMDGLEVVGAYLAEELTKAGIHSMNAHQTIYIVSPEYNNAGQMIFRDNIQPIALLQQERLYHVLSKVFSIMAVLSGVWLQSSVQLPA